MSFMTKRFNNSGYTIVGTLIVITALSLMGTALIDMSDSGTEGSNNEIQSIQATQVGSGGLQYALNQLSYGLNPNTQNKALGEGTFSITSNPATQLVTVKSEVGKAKKNQAITTSFSTSNSNININGGQVTNNSITGLTIDKTGGKQIVITGFTIDWNWNTCDANVSCENNDQTLLCHVPPGNPANKHTIKASAASHPAHLGHGDYLGPCNANDVVTALTCEATIDQMKSCATDVGNQKLKKIRFNGTDVYSGTADSNQYVSINPYFLMLNQSYSLDDIQFSSNIPANGWFSLKLHFADGSEYTKVFKFTSTGNNGNNNNGNNGNNANPGVAVKQNGNVEVNPNKNVEVKVLGSAISCGAGGSKIPVKLELGTNGQYATLFNYAAVNGGEVYSTTTSNANVNYTIRAKAALKNCSNFSATYDSNNAMQTKVLVNGQQAPALAGFGGQKPITDFLAPYLSPQGQIVLQPNQVIILFELGVNVAQNPNSPASDFQDAVVLVTVNNQ